jgi:hypothetical protein
MSHKTFRRKTVAASSIKRVVAMGLVISASLFAQQGGGGGQAQGLTPQQVAPIDITGYWESRIVDEWRFRVTPQKGDIAWMQMNADARRIAMAWDPAKDEADGKSCKAYGAVGVTQRPGLMHVTWADGNTLKLDFDTGTQTRLLHFAKAPADKGPASWQGYSAALWDTPGNVLIFTGDRYVAALVRGQAAAAPKTGTLRVTTTNMLPGYVRKNGVPYSDKAVLTEYVNRLEDNGNVYLILTQMIDDPTYLPQPYIRTYEWKQVADNKGWDPTPCLAR